MKGMDKSTREGKRNSSSLPAAATAMFGGVSGLTGGGQARRAAADAFDGRGFNSARALHPPKGLGDTRPELTEVLQVYRWGAKIAIVRLMVL